MWIPARIIGFPAQSALEAMPYMVATRPLRSMKMFGKSIGESSGVDQKVFVNVWPNKDGWR